LLGNGTFKCSEISWQFWEEKMKISKFCWGMELSSAVKYLGNFGMVMAILGIIGAVILFALPFLLGLQLQLPGIFGAAIFILFINLGWLYFSYLLNKKNTNNDVEGVKKMVKIGSYVIGSVQVAVSSVVLLAGIIFLSIPQVYLHFSFDIVMLVVGGIWLIFPSLLLHGVRTRSPGKIKPWIIFMIVCFALTLISALVGSFLGGNILKTMFQLFVMVLQFLYTSGMVIVHYNILLEDQNVLESALQNFSNEKPSKIDMDTRMRDLPPPYSYVV